MCVGGGVTGIRCVWGGWGQAGDKRPAARGACRRMGQTASPLLRRRRQPVTGATPCGRARWRRADGGPRVWLARAQPRRPGERGRHAVRERVRIWAVRNCCGQVCAGKAGACVCFAHARSGHAARATRKSGGGRRLPLRLPPYPSSHAGAHVPDVPCMPSGGGQRLTLQLPNVP